jgi:hypothetical protein
MSNKTENRIRKIVGNALLYFVMMFDFILRGCFALIYLFLGIYILIPAAVLCDIVMNKSSFVGALNDAAEACMEVVEGILH